MNEREDNLPVDPLASRDSIQIFQGTDDGSPAIISRKIALVDPEEDFRYIVVAVGEGNVDIDVAHLPEGLSYSDDGPRIDLRIEEEKPEQAAFTGVVTGKYSGASEHTFTVTVTNAKDSVTEKIRIRPQKHILPTPPMGWLSWEFCMESVSQEKIKEAIDGLDKAGLAKYGYKYVTIDDGWQGKRIPGQALQPNEKFPDMKGLSDYARSKGFILGTYTTPWINSYADFDGSAYHEELDVKQFAEWNIGYLKIDYRPWDVKQLSIWHDLMRECGTDIALSFSNHGLFDGGQEFLSDICDIWRTGQDIVPKWPRLLACAYDQYLNVEGWKWNRKGHWADPDMLQIGVLREGIEMPENEQHFQMSMWAILPAPLLLSCDTNKLSDFHMSLLTNEEVIAINQDPLGLPAKPVNGDTKVLYKPLSDGSVALGFFNNTEEHLMIGADFADFGLDGFHQIRDVWTQKDLGEMTGFSSEISPHSARLFRVR